MNGHRRKLRRLLADPATSVIVVEHRDRLARFGTEHLEAALSASGRRLIVVDEGEVEVDLVRDLIEVMTSMCARLYGRRGARNRALRSHSGAARFAFNHMLAVVKAQLDQRDAERSYGLSAAQLTPATGWSMYSLRKEWNYRKGAAAPWWAEDSKEAYSSGLLNLSQALGNWSDSRSGKRAGKAVGFPHFKRRGTTAGVRFTTGVIRVEPDRQHVTLPRLGRLHVTESTRKLARRLEAGTARILAATVTCDSRGLAFPVGFRSPPKSGGLLDELASPNIGPPGNTKSSASIWG